MKFLCAVVLLLAAPCAAHPRRHRGAALIEQKTQEEMESGAARIIHSIRGAERALTKDHLPPKLLLSEERLLHQASQFALKAGKLRSKQMHSAKKLRSIEASLIQDTQKQSSSEASGATQFASIAKKEAQLLRGGRSILKEVSVLKGDLTKALSQSDPSVTEKLEHLMDRVGGAQKEILRSESEAASHASRLAAEIRKDSNSKHRVPAAGGVFVQAHTKETSGTKDPVRRMKLSKDALSNIAAAKNEVEAAYGTDSETAQKVEGLLGQLSGSMQGLETGAEEDAHDEETTKADDEEVAAADKAKAAQLAKLKAKEEQDEANAAKAEVQAKADAAKAAKADAEKATAVAAAVESAKEAVKAKAAVMAFAQSSAHSMSKRSMSRRFRKQGLHMRKLAQRTRKLALEDHHISKETDQARRYVNDVLGDTNVGEQVSELLKEAEKDANGAANGERRAAEIENQQVQSLSDAASGLLSAEGIQ